MERNQIIGFSLIAVLFMVYIQFFSPKPTPENTTVIDNTKVMEQSIVPKDTMKPVMISDSLLNKDNTEKYGVFAAGGSGKEEELVLENKNIQVTLSTKGGNVKKVLLKNYFTYDKKPLYL
ncbi:MAG TPA: hypothetical protein VNW06_01985, partial [Cytophagaceae bacterium]|nr:hypothetical protein [Cytophagaceae bacterium]